MNNNASYLRLNDDATITQAELVAIWGALEHAAANQNRAIIHTDSLTAIQILTKNKVSVHFANTYMILLSTWKTNQ